jgi:hypothetical protein
MARYLTSREPELVAVSHYLADFVDPCDLGGVVC